MVGVFLRLRREKIFAREDGKMSKSKIGNGKMERKLWGWKEEGGRMEEGGGDLVIEERNIFCISFHTIVLCM